MINRRVLLQSTLAGAGLLAVGAQARAQTVSQTALVFISKRLDASTADYRKWYIEHHAPDFMTYAKPYVYRYAQDFVEKGHMGEVDFDCYTEFGYRSLEAREQLFHAVEDPKNQAIIARHPRIGNKPGPHEAHDGPRRFSTDHQLISGATRGPDPQGTFKQAALLRMKKGAAREAFNAAVGKYALAIGRANKDTSIRVTVDYALPEPGAMTPLYDAVVQIWPRNKADLSKAFAMGVPPEAELSNIIDIVAYESET
jgi:hypothetical protein